MSRKLRKKYENAIHADKLLHNVGTGVRKALGLLVA